MQIPGDRCTSTILVIRRGGPEIYVSFVPHFHEIIDVSAHPFSYSAIIGLLAAAVSGQNDAV